MVSILSELSAHKAIIPLCYTGVFINHTCECKDNHTRKYVQDIVFLQ